MSLFSLFLGFVGTPRRLDENHENDRSDYNSNWRIKPNRHFDDRHPQSDRGSIDRNDLSDRASQEAIGSIRQARANYHLGRRYF
jgi:hypothetical protein